MTVGISVYLANKLLDHTFRGVVFTPPASIWGKMHLADPGGAGANNPSAQVTRVQTTFAAAASGVISLNNTPEFTLNATENTVGWMSFWDLSTGGNFLFSGAATVVKGGVSGDIIRLATDTISFTPIAA